MLALDGDDSLVVLAATLGLDQQAEPTTRQQGGEITLRIGIRLGHAAHEQARFRTAAATMPDLRAQQLHGAFLVLELQADAAFELGLPREQRPTGDGPREPPAPPGATQPPTAHAHPP